MFLIHIKFINSFTNFSEEQYDMNSKLIDLKYVVDRDISNGGEIKKFIISKLPRAKFSPYLLYGVKLN